MNKDDLIEQLVLALAKRQGHDEDWLRQQPSLMAMYRRDAEVCVPVMVAFVAEWLEQQMIERHRYGRAREMPAIDEAWRRRMPS